MFDNSKWDSQEFYRGYQAALDDIHFPETLKPYPFMITAKERSGFGRVYAIRDDANGRYFLIHGRHGWEWLNSEECKPYNVCEI